jgi:hypothetical protein
MREPWSGTCLGSRVLLKIPNTSEQTVFEHVSERIDAVMPQGLDRPTGAYG